MSTGHREDAMGSVNSGRRLLELLIRHLAKDRICKRIISWAEDVARSVECLPIEHWVQAPSTARAGLGGTCL